MSSIGAIFETKRLGVINLCAKLAGWRLASDFWFNIAGNPKTKLFEFSAADLSNLDMDSLKEEAVFVVQAARSRVIPPEPERLTVNSIPKMLGPNT